MRRWMRMNTEFSLMLGGSGDVSFPVRVLSVDCYISVYFQADRLMLLLVPEADHTKPGVKQKTHKRRLRGGNYRHTLLYRRRSSMRCFSIFRCHALAYLEDGESEDEEEGGWVTGRGEEVR
jgi:hypothetical protein